jgi:DNA-binding transcriptional MerR regulator
MGNMSKKINLVSRLNYILKLNYKLELGSSKPELLAGKLELRYSRLMFYRTSHVCALFDVSYETVRIWTNEFRNFLSPTATPDKHRQRRFTEEDMRVFSLIADMKKQGMTYADIHASLHNGQRGKSPTLQPEDMQAIVGSEQASLLAIEVERLQKNLVATQEELRRALDRVQDYDEVKEENIRLSAELKAVGESTSAERERLEKQLKDLMEQLRELALLSGKEYVKGFLEGFKNKDGNES